MRARPIVFAVLVLALAAGASGQTDPWYGRAPKFQSLTLESPSGEWQIEYPRRDWIAALGGGSTLALLVQKNAEASVAIERARMSVELRADELTDFFLTAEVELLKQEQRDAAHFEQRIVNADGRRVFVVQFQRPGMKGIDRIRQYTVPARGRLYRLLCTAPLSASSRYDAVFAHIAATLAVREEQQR
jgi:hypothetical protein